MQFPFSVKVCGITCVSDARDACMAGVDAVGLNFYSKSKRFIDLEQACQIAAAASLTRVGLFVNADVPQIVDTVHAVPLDVVQLHGDEPPQLVEELSSVLPGKPVIRAFRCSADDLSAISDFVQQCAPNSLAGVLLDAYSPHARGGTGQTLEWERLEFSPSWPPVALAGGLTPDNVSDAIRACRPHAVDTASGVRNVSGEKSPLRRCAILRRMHCRPCAKIIKHSSTSPIFI